MQSRHTIQSAALTWSLVLLAAYPVQAADEPGAKGVLLKQFIYEKAPFPECHASTIAETKSGMVAAWFGGTEESHPDVGIWFSRLGNDGWSAPVEIANGVQDQRYPCWNPVLFTMPDGKLILFYKVGPSPSTWWGMQMMSHDDGHTWSQPKRLPDDILGPIKNKPVLLPSGRLLCGSSSEHDGWRVHMEWTHDGGESWQRTDVLNGADENQAIQPAILNHTNGDRLQILCRSRSAGKVLTSFSDDQGETWSELEPIALPNPNSGIDAVTLRDGRHLLVYNHTSRGRSPLNIAVSEDGKLWRAAVVLEDQPGEYSYPAIVQSSDGRVHVTYTWKRERIRYAVIEPQQLELGESYGN